MGGNRTQHLASQLSSQEVREQNPSKIFQNTQVVLQIAQININKKRWETHKSVMTSLSQLLNIETGKIDLKSIQWLSDTVSMDTKRVCLTFKHAMIPLILLKMRIYLGKFQIIPLRVFSESSILPTLESESPILQSLEGRDCASPWQGGRELGGLDETWAGGSSSSSSRTPITPFRVPAACSPVNQSLRKAKQKALVPPWLPPSWVSGKELRRWLFFCLPANLPTPARLHPHSPLDAGKWQEKAAITRLFKNPSLPSLTFRFLPSVSWDPLRI